MLFVSEGVGDGAVTRVEGIGCCEAMASDFPALLSVDMRCREPGVATLERLKELRE